MGHARHRKKNSLTRAAAWVVLVLGALTFAGAAVHFGYAAYKTSGCLPAATDTDTGLLQHRIPVDSDDCRHILSSSEDHQRRDAAIAVLAIVVAIGAAVRLSSARRRTRRLVLVVEVLVVAVGSVYIILLVSVFR